MAYLLIGIRKNFAKLLQTNGYQTAMIGKIHLNGLPQGFDYSMVLPGQGHYYNPDFLINGEKKRFEGYCTEIITETMLDWLKNKRDPNKPFCALYHQKSSASKLATCTKISDII